VSQKREWQDRLNKLSERSGSRAVLRRIEKCGIAFMEDV
jgi:hypothetical protein